MIHRDLIDRLGLRFPTDQTTCEDYHLFWRALMFARRVGYTPAPEVMIRALPDSLSRANPPAYLVKDNIKTLIEVRRWGRAHAAPAQMLRALDEHLHWQLRDQLLLLLQGGDFVGAARCARAAIREEGGTRAARSMLSAVKGWAVRARSHGAVS